MWVKMWIVCLIFCVIQAENQHMYMQYFKHSEVLQDLYLKLLAWYTLDLSRYCMRVKIFFFQNLIKIASNLKLWNAKQQLMVIPLSNASFIPKYNTPLGLIQFFKGCSPNDFGILYFRGRHHARLLTIWLSALWQDISCHFGHLLFHLFTFIFHFNFTKHFWR